MLVANADSPLNILAHSLLLPLLLSVLALATPAAGATEIHKCASPTGIAYQGTPCTGAEMPVSSMVAEAAEDRSATTRAANDAEANAPPTEGQPANKKAQAQAKVSADSAQVQKASAASGAPPCDRRPRQPKRLPWRQGTICIGMTDDEVLNLPGWGRPAKIVRIRAPREWREQWFYDTRVSASRQLLFVNGTLITVEREIVETPDGQMARLGREFDAAPNATN